MGALAGMGLGLAGVPAGGLISSVGFDLIEASYSRDQEREADVQSIDYMLAAKYDPQGAIRLHKKMLELREGLRLPFLSSHPSSNERVKNLQSVMAAKVARP